MRRRLRRVHPLLRQSGQTRQDLNPMLPTPWKFWISGGFFSKHLQGKNGGKWKKLLYFKKIPLRTPLLVTLGNDIR